MKCLIKSLLVSFLISSSLVINANGRLTVFGGPSNFCKNIFEVSITKNNDLHFKLTDSLNLLTDLSHSELANYANEVSGDLKKASELYDVLVRDLRLLCDHNREARHRYSYFKGTSEAYNEKELRARLNFVTELVDRTLTETTYFMKIIKLIQELNTRVSEKINYIQETINKKDGEREALIEKFIYDIKNYIEWLNNATKNREMEVSKVIDSGNSKQHAMQTLSDMIKKKKVISEVSDNLLQAIDATVNTMSFLRSV